MANALKTLFTDIATAIRDKTGATDTMKPIDFPAKISEISVGSGGSSDLVKYVTFIYEVNGEEKSFKMPVLTGDDCKDPIEHGDIETPTKDSTNTENFAHSGWSLTSGGDADESALASITEDLTVYAAYTASTRYYTVNFYDGDTLVDTVQVTYNSTAETKYQKDGWTLLAWNPSNENITQDTDCYGTWEEGLTFANGSWSRIAEIAEIIASGGVQDYFHIGDTKTMEVYNSSGEAVTVTLEIAAMDYDELSDGSGKAGLTILVKDAQSLGYNMGSYVVTTKTSYKNGWGKSYSRNVLNGTASGTGVNFYTNLPNDLLSVVKTVNKSYNYWDDDLVEQMSGVSTDQFWIPSVAEVEGSGYSVFSDNASRIKYSGSTASIWALRDQSLYASHNYIAAVNAKGEIVDSSTTYIANNISGNGTKFSVFGFCI